MATYAVGRDPWWVATGDLNGDGKIDLAVADNGDSDVSILLGRGTGTFQPRTVFATNTAPSSVGIGDFNGDGKLDLAVSCDNFAAPPGTVSILLGNGNGTFQPRVNYTVGTDPLAVSLGDVNNDGKLDVVTIDYVSQYITTLLGNGDGTFQAARSGFTGFTPVSLQLADFNGDGKLDAVVAESTGTSLGVGSPPIYHVAVQLGNGDGTFQQVSRYTVPGQPTRVAVGDFNGDGYVDVAASSWTKGIVSILLGNGVGGLNDYYDYAVGNGPWAIAVGDVNGDGRPDLAVTDYSSGGLSVLLGRGDGSFDAPRTFALPAGRQSDALSDVNGDGRLDFIATGGDTSVSVLLNKPLVDFHGPALATAQFGAGPGGGGWTSQSLYPRLMGDVNGDGRADLVAFGEYGVTVALANANGTFAPAQSDIRAFGHDPSSGGLTNNDIYPRLLGDVNGDGRADIVGFGDHGAYVSLATGGGHFAMPLLGVTQFGVAADAGGWTIQTLYARALGDVNGDGMADIVGFGSHGVYVSLATGGGHFGGVSFELDKFGTDPAGGGFTNNDAYPRYAADVNGDGMDDIVGFGDAGVYVSLATGGGHFAQPILAVQQFGHNAAAGGWTSDSLYPRMVGDVNGDGSADVVGFGEYGAYYALGNADGTFSSVISSIRAFGHDPSHGGLTNSDLYPRYVADITGDGLADLAAVGDNGMFAALAAANGDFIFS